MFSQLFRREISEYRNAREDSIYLQRDISLPMTEKVRVCLIWARALWPWHFRAHRTRLSLPIVYPMMSVKEWSGFSYLDRGGALSPCGCPGGASLPAFRNAAATGCEVSQKSFKQVEKRTLKLRSSDSESALRDTNESPHSNSVLLTVLHTTRVHLRFFYSASFWR